MTLVQQSLEDWRRARGATPAAFAAALGISEALYRRVLGRDPGVSPVTKAHIARQLGVPAHTIAEFVDPERAWVTTEAFLAHIVPDADTTACYEFDPATGLIAAVADASDATPHAPAPHVQAEWVACGPTGEVVTWQPMTSLDEICTMRGDSDEQFARFLGVSLETLEQLWWGDASVPESTRRAVAHCLGFDVTQIAEFQPPLLRPLALETWVEPFWTSYRVDRHTGDITVRCIRTQMHPPPRRPWKARRRHPVERRGPFTR